MTLRLLCACLCSALLAACTSTDSHLEARKSHSRLEALAADPRSTPEDLYFEVVRLQSRGLLSAPSFNALQQSLDEMDRRARTDQEQLELYRTTLAAFLRRVPQQLRSSERADEFMAEEEGRGYAEELRRSGVREAEAYGERTVLIAGMLGTPTSKGEVLLMAVTAGGGFLVVKIVKMTLGRAALAFRKMKSPEELATWAQGKGYEVQRLPALGQEASGPLVRAADELLQQAMARPPELVKGFWIHGSKGLFGATWLRAILNIEAVKPGRSPLRELLQALEAEARAAGASRLSIIGHAIRNTGFLNPEIARRFGFQFRQINAYTVELTKELAQ